MSDFHAALDPARSVVVEACAGSGKTWLLASRIVRLLMAGSAPGEILAITFTRKAAREIEERVVGWLRSLASDDDAAVGRFLADRGLDATPDRIRAARGLYEKLAGDGAGLAVHTFHGWFLQLVAAAPLSANLAGTSLADAGSRLFEELWQSFAAKLQGESGGEPARAWIDLVRTMGLAGTRDFLRRAVDRRAEWLAYIDRTEDPVSAALADLRLHLGVGEVETALADFFAPGWDADFHAYLGFLEQSELDTDARAARALAAALDGDDADARFAAIRGVFLTAAGTLRARKPGKALDQRFTPAGAIRFLDLHQGLGGRLIDCERQRIEERAYAFNRQALTVFEAFLAHFERFKGDRRQIDFIDAEWRVLQLLRDDATAAFLQARLDARYRHVLLDEFQDTNPLQWQILLAWLAAYSDAERPTVFLVGDPKQSIYRFRRAEPRLFAAAAAFLDANFAALHLAQDATRRNAPAIVEVVNALFGAEPAFQPFRPQTSLAGLPGRVELMPLCGGPEEDAGDPPPSLRDPLTTPEPEVVDGRRRKEAERVAARIGEIVGRWVIVDGAGGLRPARYGDIMLLARRRTQLAEYERALRAAGIPYTAASRGGLLETLEVRDLVALLEFLVTPVADLPLAQALRSPLFACSDTELLALTTVPGANWWERLQALAAAGASPTLVRAARLLAAWREAAARLPVHDLLDRIFDEGELLARYRAAVPAELAAGVEANLEALLLLALDLDGGRYPSLPRFIDELRALRDVDANDAPDEGTIDAGGEVGGRVSILTVHGAKGLEAPVVWLIDAHAAARGDEAFSALVDWPPDAERPAHFSFYGRKDERGEARRPLFDAEARAAEREELNLLYVAITRAKQVFVASGVDSDRVGEGTPYRRIERALAALGVGDGCYGEPLPVAAAAISPPVDADDALVPEPVAVGERRQDAEAAGRFGVLLHAVLERRTGAGAPVAGWWRGLGFDDAEHGRAETVAGRLLALPELVRFFSPATCQRAWNEVEIADREGAIYRLDRLVEFDDAIWVLDYKSGGSGSDRIGDYRQQVAGYCRLVQDLRPDKPVRGGLIFADGEFVEVGA